MLHIDKVLKMIKQSVRVLLICFGTTLFLNAINDY